MSSQHANSVTNPVACTLTAIGTPLAGLVNLLKSIPGCLCTVTEKNRDSFQVSGTISLLNSTFPVKTDFYLYLCYFLTNIIGINILVVKSY